METGYIYKGWEGNIRHCDYREGSGMVFEAQGRIIQFLGGFNEGTRTVRTTTATKKPRCR
jgi:hypothetical protein